MEVVEAVNKWRSYAALSTKDKLVYRSKLLQLLQSEGSITRDMIETIGRMVHGLDYEYDHLTGSVNTIDEPMSLMCKAHGFFEVSLANHLLFPILPVSGCPICFSEINVELSGQVVNSGTFIAKCEVIYGPKYDYSGVLFTNLADAVDIVCLDCRNAGGSGIISITPVKHLNWYGCEICEDEEED